jgi:hypothetical protein
VVAALAGTLFAAGGQAQAAPETSKDKRGVEATSTRGGIGARVAAAAEGQSGLIPVTPKRVLDTREGTGTGGVKKPIGQGETITLDLSADLPVGTSAVVLNLTGTQTTNNTYLTIWPAEVAQPEVSNINLDPNSTRSNATSVALGSSRVVKIFNNGGSAHAILDLSGYYKLNEGDKYTPKTPERVLDTRTSGPVGPQGSVDIDFSSKVPADATAVTFNLTGLAATGYTFVTAFPNGTPQPYVSNLNLDPNKTTPNLVTVRLGADKKVRLYNNVGNVHLIADLAGYFAPNSGYWFYPVAPVRELDTRDPNIGPLDPSTALILYGYKPEIKGIVGNLTGTGPTAEGYVTAWPADQNQPFVSNLNLAAGQTAANMLSVAIGPDPDQESYPGNGVLFANSAGSVHLILDLAGFYGNLP